MNLKSSSFKVEAEEMKDYEITSSACAILTYPEVDKSAGKVIRWIRRAAAEGVVSIFLQNTSRSRDELTGIEGEQMLKLGTLRLIAE